MRDLASLNSAADVAIENEEWRDALLAVIAHGGQARFDPHRQTAIVIARRWWKHQCDGFSEVTDRLITLFEKPIG